MPGRQGPEYPALGTLPQQYLRSVPISGKWGEKGRALRWGKRSENGPRIPLLASKCEEGGQ